MNVFVSCHKADEKFYNCLKDFSINRDEFTVYPHDLRVDFKEKTLRLFNANKLFAVLRKPDLAVVILSPIYLNDAWLNEELRALFAVEQLLNKKFILPILTGHFEDSEIPRYFTEQQRKYIDCRDKENFEVENLIEVTTLISSMAVPTGKVFIGHGRSPVWKDLKEFIEDRLKLECEEFNSESVAGKSNKERLLEMLNNAGFAFLIMTAEDEHADTTLHARENVIHEAGLFQGKLSFERAIILYEEGCKEFSNINGLGQIRFPRGNIGACFEEIRRVLEREGIIS